MRSGSVAGTPEPWGPENLNAPPPQTHTPPCASGPVLPETRRPREGSNPKKCHSSRCEGPARTGSWDSGHSWISGPKLRGQGSFRRRRALLRLHAGAFRRRGARGRRLPRLWHRCLRRLGEPAPARPIPARLPPRLAPPPRAPLPGTKARRPKSGLCDCDATKLGQAAGAGRRPGARDPGFPALCTHNRSGAAAPLGPETPTRGPQRPSSAPAVPDPAPCKPGPRPRRARPQRLRRPLPRPRPARVEQPLPLPRPQPARSQRPGQPLPGLRPARIEQPLPLPRTQPACPQRPGGPRSASQCGHPRPRPAGGGEGEPPRRPPPRSREPEGSPRRRAETGIARPPQR